VEWAPFKKIRGDSSRELSSSTRIQMSFKSCGRPISPSGIRWLFFFGFPPLGPKTMTDALFFFRTLIHQASFLEVNRCHPLHTRFSFILFPHPLSRSPLSYFFFPLAVFMHLFCLPFPLNAKSGKVPSLWLRILSVKKHLFFYYSLVFLPAALFFFCYFGEGPLFGVNFPAPPPGFPLSGISFPVRFPLSSLGPCREQLHRISMSPDLPFLFVSKTPDLHRRPERGEDSPLPTPSSKQPLHGP